MITEALLVAAGIYLLCGLMFAIPFVLVGVGKIDPHAARGSWGFRVLILPGTMFLWPLLARRWMTGTHEPPEENNPHRRAARHSCSSRRESPIVRTEDRRGITWSAGSVTRTVLSDLVEICGQNCASSDRRAPGSNPESRRE